MNAMSQRVAPQGVGSIFLYTHEAHPGEFYPHHTSMEQKLRHAYGSMPNMSWIFSSSGIPIYKSDWTDPASIANALEYFLDVQPRRKAGERLAPFHVERLDFRNQDRQAFYAALERNGPKAVREYRAAFG